MRSATEWLPYLPDLLSVRARTSRVHRADIIHPRGSLPAWCDAMLPPPARDALGGRAWYDATLAAALPARSVPVFCRVADGAVALPMLREGRRLRSLTTPYSLDWRPLAADPSDTAAVTHAGRDLAASLRHRPPAMLEALAPEAPGTAPFLEGLRSGGIFALTYDHFGNWVEAVNAKDGAEGYLEGRPKVLRETIRRRTPRLLARTHLRVSEEPGRNLEAGIAAYEAVRARSWKPHEPAPNFDAILMRNLAAAGALRLGWLRSREDGAVVAAQYWCVSGGRATLLKLAHDEAWREASPGTVLTALLLAEILGRGEVHELDLGRGDDPYKRLWADRRRRRIGVLLADPRHPEGLLAVARHTAGRAIRAVRARARPLAVAGAA